MNNQVIDTAKDAGGPPEMLLIDTEASPDLPPTPEMLDSGNEASNALDGGSPPDWLIQAVSGEEEKGRIETPNPPETMEPMSAEALSAGAAPEWIGVSDTDTDTYTDAVVE